MYIIQTNRITKIVAVLHLIWLGMLKTHMINIKVPVDKITTEDMDVGNIYSL